MLPLLLAVLGLAHAESPGVLSKGAAVLYSGAGLTTFGQLTQNGEVVTRDRELRPRLDLYGSLGLLDGLQASVSAPLVYSTVLDDPGELPCPGLLQSEGYCESYVTVGQARVDLRYGVLRRKQKLTVGLAADIDNWNAGRRGQYNSAGSGRTMVEALVVTGGRVEVGDWALRGLILGAYGVSLAPSVTSLSGADTVKAPGDTARASVEGRVNTPGPVAFEVGGHVVQRLSGVDLDNAWVAQWFTSSLDRWNVLAYRGIALSGKVSVDLPNNMGLHAGVFRTISVANGASDLTDISLGWHTYFAP